MNTYTNFELNGKTYTDTANGYYWVTENGKKSRISRAAFVEAWNKYLNWTTEVAKAVVAETAEVEEIVAKVEEEITTEEVEAVAAEMAPKAKKKSSRAKKNAAFRMDVDGTEITLTAKQVDFIKHLPDTCFWENGIDSIIWVDCLCDDIGGQFEGKPMTVGAMISTICEKGLGSRGTDRRNGRKCTCFALTETGKVVAKKLGLR